MKSGLGIEAQRNAVVEYLNGGNWSLVKEYVEVESGKNAEERVGSDRVKTDTMTTIDIIRCSDGTYAITVNGAVVAAGLTNGAAWREADRLVESDTNLAVQAHHPSTERASTECSLYSGSQRE